VRNSQYLARMLLRWIGVTSSISTLSFLAAGTTSIASLRNYLIVFCFCLLVTMVAIDPGLGEERSRNAGVGTKPSRLSAGLLFLATLSLAALDIGRIHCLNPVSAVRSSSLILFASSSALQLWAMVANPFFSPEIRLQAERGHKLIAHGPYRFLRHPGYLAMVVSALASATAIGSWLALVPAIAFGFTIVRRVRAEENFLQKNLGGYADYMHQVGGGLFPRISISRRPHPLVHASAATPATSCWSKP
jgi:protein-S-isoprenylcysteine O-methyltransferase Ste14